MDLVYPSTERTWQKLQFQILWLASEEEAKAYLNHIILGSRLRDITKALLEHRGHRTIRQLMGSDIDVIKLRSLYGIV